METNQTIAALTALVPKENSSLLESACGREVVDPLVKPCDVFTAVNASWPLLAEFRSRQMSYPLAALRKTIHECALPLVARMKLNRGGNWLRMERSKTRLLQP